MESQGGVDRNIFIGGKKGSCVSLSVRGGGRVLMTVDAGGGVTTRKCCRKGANR